MKHSASKLAGFPGFKVSAGFGDKRIELPFLEIGFNLLIPQLRIELKEPLPKLSQVLGRQIQYLLLNL